MGERADGVRIGAGAGQGGVVKIWGAVGVWVLYTTMACVEDWSGLGELHTSASPHALVARL